MRVELPCRAHDNSPYLLAYTTYRVLHQRQLTPDSAMVKTARYVFQQQHEYPHITHRAKYHVDALPLNCCATRPVAHQNAIRTAT